MSGLTGGWVRRALGVALLVSGSWALGYRSALARTQSGARTAIPAVIGHTEPDRLCQPSAEKDAEIARLHAALRDAEANLAAMQKKLKTSKRLIERYSAELAATPAPETAAPETGAPE